MARNKAVFGREKSCSVTGLGIKLEMAGNKAVQ